jgi:type I restriction enzyme S subunit
MKKGGCLSWHSIIPCNSESYLVSNVNSNDIKLLHVKIHCLAEQQKIAAVLTNDDKEIELLEQQLADSKKEKKSLMQQLLMGKRSVNIQEAEIA